MGVEVLGICGSPVKDGNTAAFLEAVAASLKEPGMRVSIINVAPLNIADCLHCNFCIAQQTKEKICAIEDDMAEIYPQVLKADVLLFASPVYLMRLSGYLARFMDRLRALLHGKVYHRALADKVGMALAGGWFRNTGIETALLSIVSGMLTLGMIPVGSGGLGAGAVSSKGGTGRFAPENRLGALEGGYGIEAGKKALRRAVFLAKAIKAGKEALFG